jgi:triacylglycerol lipase
MTLSQLLRRILLGQALAGILLGWWLTSALNLPAWLALMGAPLVTVLMSALTSVILAVRSRAPGASAMWWRSIWGEFKADLRFFVLQMPWTRQAPVLLPARTSPTRLPVLLVHGYLCNHRVWDAMAQRLRAAGHPVLAINLEPLFTSIDHYAEPIEQAVTALCGQTGARQVALVGHSMGGLAIRSWLRAHGSERAARVITLGSPHAGTQIAPHTRTPNGRQMIWHSPWLQTLAQSETPATRALMRIALTPQDNIVYPQRDQVLAGVPVTVFDGLGHLELLLEPAVSDWVISELDDLT